MFCSIWKSKFWNFLLTIQISYFLFFRYLKISRSTITWKDNLPHFYKFFSSSFSSTSPVVGMPKGVHVWLQLDNEFPPDSHNYTGLNKLKNSFSWFTISPPNKLILGYKPHWSAKSKNTTSCEKWLLGGVLQKIFPTNFSKFTEK